MTTSPTAIPALARANELALVAAFAGLIVALGTISIPVPGSSVPVTGQTLGVLLAANVLGGRRGFMAVGLVLLLGALGMPVFAGGHGGASVLVSATGGYLWGMLLMAAVVGALVERLPEGRVALPARLVINLTLGIFLVYLIGVPWLSVVIERPVWETFGTGLTPFIPGDIFKAVSATLIAHTVVQPLSRAGFLLQRRAS